MHEKPEIIEREDRLKEEYLNAVEDVTKRIQQDEVKKVVIGRSLN